MSATCSWSFLAVCSIGIALYPEHGRDPITLARHADQAMYQAKQSGRERVRLAELSK